MLAHRLGPRSDEQGVFLKLLDALRDVRLRAKEQMTRSRSRAEKLHYDALQGTFKILINSFYGYLGFAQARFSDFAAAEKVTALGRDLLAAMIGWLKAHGATPIEMDTDGIYFVPPAARRGDVPLAGPALARFRRAFAASLPEGIEIEFDGEYRAMFSYKMKNYALLAADGEMTVKGAALKSRGLEPFQRAFLRELLRLKLEGQAGEIPALAARYERAIRGAEWPIAQLAKSERLTDSPATYAARLAQGKTPRNALYELALRSGRPYRAGDQLSYYVTGEKKSVAVHENCKLVADWDARRRDENVAYYLAKLAALCAKFGAEPEQKELGLAEAAFGAGGENDESEA